MAYVFLTVVKNIFSYFDYFTDFFYTLFINDVEITTITANGGVASAGSGTGDFGRREKMW